MIDSPGSWIISLLKDKKSGRTHDRNYYEQNPANQELIYSNHLNLDNGIFLPFTLM